MQEAFTYNSLIHQERPNKPERRLIRKYVGWYAEGIRHPITLLGPTEMIIFRSDVLSVYARRDALADYLKDPPDTSKRSWGQTIFAETIVLRMLRNVFSPILKREGMCINPTPTSMDCSIDANGNYQKGADFYLAEEIKDQSHTYKPICGIDVTVANGSTVAHKRIKPGLQLTTAIPVILLPFKKPHGGCEGTSDFPHYLDQCAREAVLKGIHHPFYGLTTEEIALWKTSIGEKLAHEIERCKQGIADCEDPRITSFNHLPHVFTQLEVMRELVNKYKTQVAL